MPGYKEKTTGRNLLVYSLQALRGGQSKKGIQRVIQPSGLAIEVTTQQDPSKINQVRIVPKHGHYVVEVIYTKQEQQAELNPAYIAGIDVGVNNLVALTSNKPGFQPVVVNGRPVKSTNQFYNKRRAELQKALTRKGSTRRMDRLTNKRNRRIEHYMHTTSRMIVNLLVKEGIGTLVIGKNDGWKQNVNMGKQNNQNFCQISHAKLISMLTYKKECWMISRVRSIEISHHVIHNNMLWLRRFDPASIASSLKHYTTRGENVRYSCWWQDVTEREMVGSWSGGCWERMKDLSGAHNRLRLKRQTFTKHLTRSIGKMPCAMWLSLFFHRSSSWFFLFSSSAEANPFA